MRNMKKQSFFNFPLGNKKGIQLSVNFIVMLIIALVVFGMGLVLFRKFFIEAEDIRANLDEQTKQELQAKMMSSPDQVVVYPTTMTIRRGKADVFGVGVLNIGATGEFTIKMEFDENSCYFEDGSRMSGCTGNEVSIIDEIVRDIPANERSILDIPAKVESTAGAGKYAVRVIVENTEGNDISTHIVYINVP